jgi:3-isopropylmalate dehydrogenase
MRILVLPGDGIGSDISTATVEVVTSAAAIAGFSPVFSYADIGFASLQKHGTTFTDDVFALARDADGVILGPVSHNEYPPAKVRPGFAPRCGTPFDLVVVRENTEGFYADRTMFVGTGEVMPTPDLAMAFRKVTREGSTRIAEAAFKLAMQRRKKVTAVHKANVLRVSDGLFLECVRGVAGHYPDVEYDEKLIDAMAALLIRDPSVYDVIVTTNMFGDILSDEASELSGSLGLAASLNAGREHGVAQAQHGSAPDIAGKDLANPSSLIGSAAMLLAWMGERRGEPPLLQAAALIEAALDRVIADPAQRTRDLGGTLGTAAFTRLVVGALRA